MVATWTQVIPYLVLRVGGRIYLMRRIGAGSDARLHERWSIGIGGHVNPTLARRLSRSTRSAGCAFMPERPSMYAPSRSIGLGALFVAPIKRKDEAPPEDERRLPPADSPTW